MFTMDSIDGDRFGINSRIKKTWTEPSDGAIIRRVQFQTVVPPINKETYSAYVQYNARFPDNIVAHPCLLLTF